MYEPKLYWVYMLASKPYGTLYTGFTGDISGRVYEHKNDLTPGFTSQYGVHILVWYETHGHVHAAIDREKQIKGWNRDWKIRLIEKMNPDWEDLFPQLLK
jgi:putative endonuclease